MSAADQEVLSWWRKVLGPLDPMQPLRAEDVGRLYTERPDAPYKMIAARLRRSPALRGQTILIYGARGAGKSSELSRLGAELKDEYTIVHVDLGAGLPETTSTLALVVLLGAAALHGLAQWERPDVPPSSGGRGKDLLAVALKQLGLSADFLGGLLKHVGPALALVGADSGVSAAAGGAWAVSALAHAAALRRELGRGPLGERLTSDRFDDARAVADAVNTIFLELEARAGRPPLLLADGLDKRTRLEDVSTALADRDLLASLAAPMVLTGPVVLRHDPRFRSLESGSAMFSLPNVAVRRRGGRGGHEVVDNEDGIALLRELSMKRLATVDVHLDDLMERGALGLAARMSSGIIREFLTILTSAGDAAQSAGERRISAAHVEAAVRRIRLSLQASLDEQDWQILARLIQKPGTLPADDRADVLLYENFIACYANGDLWYRPHEAIAGSVSGVLGSDADGDE